MTFLLPVTFKPLYFPACSVDPTSLLTLEALGVMYVLCLLHVSVCVWGGGKAVWGQELKSMSFETDEKATSLVWRTNGKYKLM